jgi:fumarate hydratase class II
MMAESRMEADGFGKFDVDVEKLWSAQTQRSLHHFRVGNDFKAREMITACDTLERAMTAASRGGARRGTSPIDAPRDPPIGGSRNWRGRIK